MELDSDGVPFPAMVTGFDLIPKYEHYELLSLRISEVYRCTLEDALNLSASEFLRRLAMCKASKWSQDSDATRAHNKELKRRGK